MYFGATTHVHTSFFRIYMHGWNAVPMTMTITALNAYQAVLCKQHV